ncbi:hypothetical protein Xen7305DRAFT_00020950 [Xenococcus sp. PCC 7305]|uniref:type II toxin-antitoxin system HicB family antitoxin n=1 Tax=Xenococcus sp. PCC 7305 TaxID=102125 RepID=UPI0002AC278B|nr:type II toxin-antitoxin system HicB family antitoxin [Xenococcus sp. PCC 7305]ELS02381.1 hypothetical protein Xen7305DRAFT_00020950 [Xenococcus sp. PCC 7305]
MGKVIDKSLEFYLNLKYAISVYPEETGRFTVMIPELSGCMSQGETIEEAFQNLEKARRYWMVRAWDSGNAIPLPNE